MLPDCIDCWHSHAEKEASYRRWLPQVFADIRRPRRTVYG